MNTAKYLNPYTDFGFKKIFGEEASKPLMIDFLNSLLPEHHQIADLEFRTNTQLGANTASRSPIYDIFCQSNTGERFIVEMQQINHKYFKDRTLYYSTFPIQEQAKKGDWNYNLSAVYCIGIVDFLLDSDIDENDVVHTVQLKNQHNAVFYDKLTFIFLEMPSFNKKENELATRLDKWLYFLKNLVDFQQMPAIFDDQVFIQAFDTARIATLEGDELDSYHASLKALRDDYAVWRSGIKDAFAKGEEKGREEGIEKGIGIGAKQATIKTAQELKALGVADEIIIQSTGLTLDEVHAL